MASFSENTGIKTVTIKWFIENFQYCWHKPGERLESPLFHVNFASETSWRLWLYPRAEDNGEYTSLYLFRDEGGPEVVDIDFELINMSAGSSSIGKLNWHSFKTQQREGLKYFASRSELFASKDAQRDAFVLCIGCRISSEGFESSRQSLFTKIEIGRIFGSEIWDDIAYPVPLYKKEIDVKPLLKDDPLININLSYVEESLVIKIRPVCCHEIKYAVCKITVLKNWGRESSIERVRSWIGEIKADSWRHCVPLPGTESFKPDLESFTDKAFFVHYSFTFSTGEIVAERGIEECDRLVNTFNVSFQEYFSLSPKSAPSALDALEEIYRSGSFSDVKVKTSTGTFNVHKAILCARSAKFRSLITENSKEISLDDSDFLENIFLFVYTDTTGLKTAASIFKLYKLSVLYDLEPLTVGCRNFLTANLDGMKAASTFVFACSQQDLRLKTAAENFIAEHYESVINSTNWECLDEPEFRKEILFLKYRK